MKNFATTLLVIYLLIFSSKNVYSQYPAGLPATDFTATDINGVTHNLYTILNSGKTVFLDFSTTWCHVCWDLHETHALDELYTKHGPSGTNDVMVLFIESDKNTTLAQLNGIGFNTKGNWVAGTTHPIIDDATIQDNYYVQGYPTLYMICPNKTVTSIWQMTADQFYEQKQSGCTSSTVAPKAAFLANTVTPCGSNAVSFIDQSQGGPTAWQWSFSPNTVTFVNGTSASSQSPKVQFSTAGPYSVTLKITVGNASVSTTKTNYISPNMTSSQLPLLEKFEGATFPPAGWTVQNSDAPAIAWGTDGAKGIEKRAATGNSGSELGCAALNSFSYADTSKTDALISSNISLGTVSTPILTFNRAYKTNTRSGSPGKFMDELFIYISTDCGTTWGNPVFKKKGVALATAGNSSTSFSPAAAADWIADTVDLRPFLGQTIAVKFEFINRNGNNLYIDDINISNALPVASSVAISSNAANNIICAGTATTFTAVPTKGGVPSYQWKINGVNVGPKASTFTVSNLIDGQMVTCVMTSSIIGTSPVTSEQIKIVVKPTVTPSVSVAITAGGNPTCTSQSVTFTATPIYGGTNPDYQWKVNNVNAGSNSATFTPTSIANNALITCDMTSKEACPTKAIVTSTEIKMQVTSSVVPAVSIAMTSSGTVTCVGSNLQFKPSPTNGGNNPTYVWTVNGNQVSTNAILSTSTLSNNDEVKCLMTSTSTCASTPNATSNGIKVSLIPNVTPTAAITSANLTVCQGEDVTFNVTSTNGGLNPSYLWFVNGTATTTTGSKFVSKALASGSSVSCMVTSNENCLTVSSAKSTPLQVTIKAKPLIAVSSNSPVCAGETIVFSATTLTGAAYAWSGPSSYTSTVQNSTISNANASHNGTYSITVSQNGCDAVETVSVVVNSSLIEPSITRNGNTLVSSASTGNQWYFNNAIVPGATAQTLPLMGDGSYTVKLHNSACSITSKPYVLGVVGFEEIADGQFNVVLSPNPTSGESVFKLVDDFTGEITIEVVNIHGQTIEKESFQKDEMAFEKPIVFTNQEKGVYFVSVQAGNRKMIYKLLYY